MSSGRKGSSFERWFATQLSLWWSGGKRDDIFWRTQNSGGRATTRLKDNKRTKGQYGDIAAVDPEGEPLLDLVIFELKRGYPRVYLMDLIDFDKPLSTETHDFVMWLKKISKNRDDSGAKYWMLVWRRDRRVAVIYFSGELAEEIKKHGGPTPPNIITTGECERGILCAMRLSDFFTYVSPDIFRSILKGVRDEQARDISGPRGSV